MTREEIIKGLKWILESRAAACGPAGDVGEFLRPAIQYLEQEPDRKRRRRGKLCYRTGCDMRSTR